MDWRFLYAVILRDRLLELSRRSWSSPMCVAEKKKGSTLRYYIYA